MQMNKLKEDKERLLKQATVVILSDKEEEALEANRHAEQKVEQLNKEIEGLKNALNKERMRVAAKSSDVEREKERQTLLMDKFHLKNNHKLLQHKVNNLKGLLKRYQPATITYTVML